MSIPITNEKGASAPGHTWLPGEVVEVEEKLAEELLSIKDAGFKVATEALDEVEKVVDKVKTEVDPQPTLTEVDPEVTDATPKKAPASTAK